MATNGTMKADVRRIVFLDDNADGDAFLLRPNEVGVQMDCRRLYEFRYNATSRLLPFNQCVPFTFSDDDVVALDFRPQVLMQRYWSDAADIVNATDSYNHLFPYKVNPCPICGSTWIQGLIINIPERSDYVKISLNCMSKTGDDSPSCNCGHSMLLQVDRIDAYGIKEWEGFLKSLVDLWNAQPTLANLKEEREGEVK